MNLRGCSWIVSSFGEEMLRQRGALAPTVVESSESCRNEPPKKLKTTETPKKVSSRNLNTIPLKEYTYIFSCPLF